MSAPFKVGDEEMRWQISGMGSATRERLAGAEDETDGVDGPEADRWSQTPGSASLQARKSSWIKH